MLQREIINQIRSLFSVPQKTDAIVRSTHVKTHFFFKLDAFFCFVWIHSFASSQLMVSFDLLQLIYLDKAKGRDSLFVRSRRIKVGVIPYRLCSHSRFKICPISVFLLFCLSWDYICHLTCKVVAEWLELWVTIQKVGDSSLTSKLLSGFWARLFP